MYILLIIATAIIALATLFQGYKAVIDIWDYFKQRKGFPKSALLITVILVIVSMVFGYATVTSSANTFSPPSTSVTTPTPNAHTTPPLTITDSPPPTVSPSLMPPTSSPTSATLPKP